jgi:hypothetical protein
MIENALRLLNPLAPVIRYALLRMDCTPPRLKIGPALERAGSRLITKKDLNNPLINLLTKALKLQDLDLSVLASP